MDELNDLESLCLLVEEYKVALEEAERTISFMNNKISLIEKEKEDSNDQHEQIIKELEETIIQLDIELETSNYEYRTLATNLNNLEGKSNYNNGSSQFEINKLKDENRSLKKENISLTKALQKYEYEMEKKSNAICDLELELDDEIHYSNELLNQIDILRGKIGSNNTNGSLCANKDGSYSKQTQSNNSAEYEINGQKQLQHRRKSNGRISQLLPFKSGKWSAEIMPLPRPLSVNLGRALSGASSSSSLLIRTTSQDFQAPPPLPWSQSSSSQDIYRTVISNDKFIRSINQLNDPNSETNILLKQNIIREPSLCRLDGEHVDRCHGSGYMGVGEDVSARGYDDKNEEAHVSGSYQRHGSFSGRSRGCRSAIVSTDVLERANLDVTVTGGEGDGGGDVKVGNSGHTSLQNTSNIFSIGAGVSDDIASTRSESEQSDTSHSFPSRTVSDSGSESESGFSCTTRAVISAAQGSTRPSTAVTTVEVDDVSLKFGDNMVA